MLRTNKFDINLKKIFFYTNTGAYRCFFKLGWDNKWKEWKPDKTSELYTRIINREPKKSYHRLVNGACRRRCMGWRRCSGRGGVGWDKWVVSEQILKFDLCYLCYFRQLIIRCLVTVAQLAERMTFNHVVGGSNPSRDTKFC